MTEVKMHYAVNRIYIHKLNSTAYFSVAEGIYCCPADLINGIIDFDKAELVSEETDALFLKHIKEMLSRNLPFTI